MKTTAKGKRKQKQKAGAKGNRAKLGKYRRAVIAIGGALGEVEHALDEHAEVIEEVGGVPHDILHELLDLFDKATRAYGVELIEADLHGV